ncbi:hypothetical protein D3C77_492920 [compost metagenome]
MSADNSGGVRSSTDLAAATIEETGSDNASCTSFDVIVTVSGKPDTMSLPRISNSAIVPVGYTVPIAILISSAVRSPMSSLYFVLIYLIIAVSNVSPAILMDEAVTMSPMESTATSVVPPPISTTMLPLGSYMSIPAPMAAAFGSSSKNTSLAPLCSAASRIDFCSTDVIFVGAQIRTRG